MYLLITRTKKVQRIMAMAFPLAWYVWVLTLEMAFVFTPQNS
jgi:hypothetical protein